MANVQGEGTLAIAGGGDVLAGLDVTVAGMLDVDRGYLLS
jgi:NAD(P)H-hydrate repair Nnr-like enzyme with NAD(P)H-hydrate dehydratase domain